MRLSIGVTALLAGKQADYEKSAATCDMARRALFDSQPVTPIMKIEEPR
jgi:hypothetical protein